MVSREAVLAALDAFCSGAPACAAARDGCRLQRRSRTPELLSARTLVPIRLPLCFILPMLAAGWTRASAS